MAKDGTEAENETESAEPEKKSKKKLIIGVVIVLVAVVGAKMFILKPKALTPAEVAAQAKVAKDLLHDECAGANGLKLLDPKVTPTTIAVDTTKVLTPNDQSVTVNLADGAYLKVGIALQLAAGIDPKVAKDDGFGDHATDITLKELARHTMAGLAPPSARNKVQQQLSFDVCMAYEAKVLSVYFTEFVMQAP